MMIEEEPEIINTQNYKNNEKAIKPQQNYYINATYKKTALLFDCYLWHVCQNGSDVIGKQIKFRFTKIHFGRSKFCKKNTRRNAQAIRGQLTQTVGLHSCLFRGRKTCSNYVETFLQSVQELLFTFVIIFVVLFITLIAYCFPFFCLSNKSTFH